MCSWCSRDNRQSQRVCQSLDMCVYCMCGCAVDAETVAQKPEWDVMYLWFD
eukprot:m.124866 g.124866  ORF g.124866 m.124866 type:complete len:51 (+) comp12965_c0_seq4:3561-3713(+)